MFYEIRRTGGVSQQRCAVNDRSLAPSSTDRAARSTDTNSVVGADWQTNGCRYAIGRLLHDRSIVVPKSDGPTA